MTESAPTILRGPDGAPQHVVLTWETYQSLLARGPASDPTPPEDVACRLAEGLAPVRAWREHRGLVQAALAGAVGISRAYLAQIETGERVGTVEVLARLARRLGCRIEDLVQRADEAMRTKLDRLAAMPGELETIAASVGTKAWAHRPGPDRFSLIEHVCHLRDVDRDAYRVRIERILAEDHPALADFDGTRAAAERGYQRQDPAAALAAFRQTRAAIVERLNGLTPALRQRRGTQEGVGGVSIDDVVDAMLAHDSEHRDELAELARSRSKV